MGIGASLFFIAVGAILKYAVDLHPKGIDVQAVGSILILVGVLGAILSLIFWESWGGWRRRDPWC